MPGIAKNYLHALRTARLGFSLCGQRLHARWLKSDSSRGGMQGVDRASNQNAPMPQRAHTDTHTHSHSHTVTHKALVWRRHPLLLRPCARLWLRVTFSRTYGYFSFLYVAAMVKVLELRTWMPFSLQFGDIQDKFSLQFEFINWHWQDQLESACAFALEAAPICFVFGRNWPLHV